MSGYYTRTFIGLAVVFAVLLVAALLANSVASEARARYRSVAASATLEQVRHAADHEQRLDLEAAMVPVREFVAAWSQAARMSERDAAEQIRSDLEAIAQRQLGLVTDGAITPQPLRYSLQGLQSRVQQVTLRASGKDLAALLSWLGKAEEKYPAAIIEHVDFSSNVGGNTGLTLRLVQPLQEPEHRIVPTVPPTSEKISAMAWPHYLPARVKAAVAVGFDRNPLQPAIQGERQSSTLPHDDTDEVARRVAAALDGRIRSVIRGVTPIVVVDGRVFRVGDEILIGPARERPVSQAKTKVKEIGDDRLLFHVAGGSAERPVQCDVVYALPEFLRNR